jgi:hypothetical protein
MFIFIWLIWDDEYGKTYCRLKNILEYVNFLLYFNYLFSFHENSWDGGRKKSKSQNHNDSNSFKNKFSNTLY